LEPPQRRIEIEFSFVFMVRRFVSLRRLARSLRKARGCLDAQTIRSLRSADAMAKRVLDTGLHVTGATGDETLVFDKQ